MLIGDVDEEMTALAVKALIALDADSAKPVTIYISSYGGEVPEALSIIDTARAMRSSVDTVAMGKCMSAGAIMASCMATGWRYTYPSVRWMVHDVTAGAHPGSCHRSLGGSARETATISDMLVELLGSRTAMPERHWLKLFAARADTYFGSEQALEWGLIDGIL